MKQVQIKAFLRKNIGGKFPKKLRQEGYVPAIVYGGKELYPICVVMRELATQIDSPQVCFFQLDLEGKKIACTLQRVQKDPVSELLLHVDFLEIIEDRLIKMEVPLRLEGNAPGVLAGGVMEVLMPRIAVKALSKDIPEEILLDISNLNLGKTLRIKDLKKKGVTFPAPALTPIVKVAIPRALKTATEE